MIDQNIETLKFYQADILEKRKMKTPLCDIKGTGVATLTFSYDRQEADTDYHMSVYVDGKELSTKTATNLPFYNRDSHFHNRRLNDIEFKESLLVWVFTNNNTYNNPYGFFDVDVTLYEDDEYEKTLKWLTEKVEEEKKEKPKWYYNCHFSDLKNTESEHYLELVLTSDPIINELRDIDALFGSMFFKPNKRYVVPTGRKFKDPVLVPIHGRILLNQTDIEYYESELISEDQFLIKIYKPFTDGLGEIILFHQSSNDIQDIGVTEIKLCEEKGVVE